MSELRLAVGTPSGPHGVSWRLWANNDSFYVLGREFRTSMKLSVHPPSDKGPDLAFFYGFQKNWLDKNPEGMVPADHAPLMRYYPTARAPGVTRFATLRTPGSVLRMNLQLHNPRAKIEWLAPPDKGGAVDLHLLLVENRAEAAEWCRANLTEGSLHSAIVDESVLGDLLVVQAYRRVAVSPIVVAADNPDDLTVIAFGVQQPDGSLLIEQTRPVSKSSAT